MNDGLYEKDVFRVFSPDTVKNGIRDRNSRVELFPVRVLWTQGSAENCEALLKPREQQISLEGEDACILSSKGRKKAAVLLDFGIEIHGGIRILAWKDKSRYGSAVRVRFGESAMEAMSEIGPRSTATNDHARRDILIRVGSMSMNPVGETGFRFVRIDLEEPGGWLSLKSVCAVLVYRDMEYKGSFSCSDPLLNRIWNVGAYTVHLNTQEYIWDGIKRDRLVWMGDLHPEITTIQAVFGEIDSVEKSLDFIQKETPLPGWMNHMAPYSMWYCINVWSWYRYTGDRTFLEKRAGYLKGIMEQLSDEIGPDGLDTAAEGRFLDWPSSENLPAVDAGMQAVHLLAVKSLKQIFEVLGDQDAVSRCLVDILRLAGADVNPAGSKQAAALLVLSGLLDAALGNEAVLKPGGAAGMSTFMGYYILTARAMAGDHQGCLDVIRDFWGGMLKLGATTFWEDFDIRWMKGAARIDELPRDGETDVHGTYGGYCYKGYRHSLCHGWAAGVTPWLSEQVLGIQILEPGCRRVKIEPHLGDLSFAKGSYPTPHGVIRVSHRRMADGRIETEAEGPEGVELVLP